MDKNKALAHSGSTGSIRILIADDRPQVRESLQALLETEDDLAVVGQARDGREALNQCATLAPDVVLMDLEMPVLDGLSATRVLRRRNVCPVIVILSVHAGQWWRDQAAQAGANAFVSKTDHPERIIQAIRQAAILPAGLATTSAHV